MGKQWKQWETILGGSKMTADGDCSHEIKRHLLLERKVMTNLDSILKSRDIILPTKVCLVKAMVSPVVMYGYESWTIKKAEQRRIDAFKLWCWRRLLRAPWTSRRSNHSILKEISPEYSLERVMLKLKLQYFGHLYKQLTPWKRPWCWERLKAGEGDDRGWYGQMASPSWHTWVWEGSESWWWTGKPGVLQSMASQRVRHNWVTELNLKLDPTSGFPVFKHFLLVILPIYHPSKYPVKTPCSTIFFLSFVFQLLSCVLLWDQWTAALQAFLSFTIS